MLKMKQAAELVLVLAEKKGEIQSECAIEGFRYY